MSMKYSPGDIIRNNHGKLGVSSFLVIRLSDKKRGDVPVYLCLTEYGEFTHILETSLWEKSDETTSHVGLMNREVIHKGKRTGFVLDKEAEIRFSSHTRELIAVDFVEGYLTKLTNDFHAVFGNIFS